MFVQPMKNEAAPDGYAARGAFLSRDDCSLCIAALRRDAHEMRARGGAANVAGAKKNDDLAQALGLAVTREKASGEGVTATGYVPTDSPFGDALRSFMGQSEDALNVASDAALDEFASCAWSVLQRPAHESDEDLSSFAQTCELLLSRRAEVEDASEGGSPAGWSAQHDEGYDESTDNDPPDSFGGPSSDTRDREGRES